MVELIGFVVRRNNGSTTQVVLTEKFGSNTEYKHIYNYSQGMTIKVARVNGVMRYYDTANDTWVDLQDINSYTEAFDLHTWIGAFSNESALNKDGSTSTPGRFINATLSNIYIKLESDVQPDVTVSFNIEGVTIFFFISTFRTSNSIFIIRINLCIIPSLIICGNVFR